MSPYLRLVAGRKDTRPRREEGRAYDFVGFFAPSVGEIRTSEIAPATAVKAASSTITSRPADKRSRAPACIVLWPEPVATASRHASSEDAAATPMLMPSERITLRRPPASPVRLAGAAAMIALLLGEMNNPWPIPNSASASITSRRLPAVPSMA